jgi:hypothetical protein
MSIIYVCFRLMDPTSITTAKAVILPYLRGLLEMDMSTRVGLVDPPRTPKAKGKKQKPALIHLKVSKI